MYCEGDVVWLPNGKRERIKYLAFGDVVLESDKGAPLTKIIPETGFTGPFGDNGRRAARPDFDSYVVQVFEDNKSYCIEQQKRMFMITVFDSLFKDVKAEEKMRNRSGACEDVWFEHPLFGAVITYLSDGLFLSITPPHLTDEEKRMIIHGLYTGINRPERLGFNVRDMSEKKLNEAIDYIRQRVAEVMEKNKKFTG